MGDLFFEVLEQLAFRLVGGHAGNAFELLVDLLVLLLDLVAASLELALVLLQVAIALLDLALQAGNLMLARVERVAALLERLLALVEAVLVDADLLEAFLLLGFDFLAHAQRLVLGLDLSLAANGVRLFARVLDKRVRLALALLTVVLSYGANNRITCDNAYSQADDEPDDFCHEPLLSDIFRA